MQLLVSYDLRIPGRSYQALYDALEQMGGYRLLESLWYVDANYSPKSLGLRLRLVLDDSDGLFVSELGEWASWRTDRLPPSS